jgi:hypothetical protein
MRLEMRFVPALVIWLLIASGVNAGDDSGGVIDVMGSSCEQGPSKQPNGHFLAFVFCDSALGSNLGIILSRLTNDTDATGVWGVDQRFWQDGPWVTDVTSFAWDPFSNRLYVATDDIYGDGGVFVLDLLNKKHERIYSIGDIDSQTVQNTATKLQAESHFGFIEELDVGERSVTVSIRLAYGDGQSIVVGRRTVRLGSGT